MMMFSRHIAVVSIVALVAGCAPDGQGGTTNILEDLQTSAAGITGQSPEQRELSRLNRQYANARIQAAAIGAVGGLLICQIRSCTDAERAAAVIGGGAAGYLTGGYLVNRDIQFRGTQETLQRDIQVAREDRDRLRASVAAARDVVSYQRAEIARLNQGLSAGTVTVQQYRARLQTMQGDIDATRALQQAARENIQGLNNSINNHRNAGLSTGELRASRDAQQTELNRLRQAEQQMLANIARAPSSVRT